MTAARKVIRALAVPVALIIAVIAQLTIVNRAPLPGGGAPDLVLLVVAASAVTMGPMVGTLAGFAGGLALDVAPPGGHLAGEYALVFCLVGYFCGRISAAIEDATGERQAVTSLTLVALGAAAGEAGKAALGMMVSDPNVTGPAIKHVLPGAILYDLLLAPFVLWLMAVAVRRPAPERAPQPVFSQSPRLAGALRGASVGAAPGLRLAGSTRLPVPPSVRSEPRLRLANARSPALSRTAAASSLAPTAMPGGRTPKVGFATAGRGNSLGAASALRTPQGLNGKSPGKGWLRADKLAGMAAVATTPARKSPPRGWLRADRPAGAPAPRFKSPGSGWLRPDRPKRPAWRGKSPGRGWLRPDKPAPAPRLKSPGRGWLRPVRPVRRNWYTRSPSGRWLRRGRSPWRSRSVWRSRKQRLRQMVGGRR
jgi:rod shape-determining protein MreD